MHSRLSNQTKLTLTITLTLTDTVNLSQTLRTLLTPTKRLIGRRNFSRSSFNALYLVSDHLCYVKGR